MVKEVTIRALRPFLTRPHEQLHLADIARTLKTPHPTVRLWLKALEKEGILRTSTKGRLSLYALNREHPFLLEYLVMAEHHALLNTASPLLRELVRTVRGQGIATAILFGSAVVDPKNANDIDLLTTGHVRPEGIKAFAKRYGKEVHHVNVADLDMVTPALKAEVQKRHLLIAGAERAVRWLVW